MTRASISAVIISFNEERNIRRCLESLKWVDEIILVDSHSTDRTREIAREYTDNIILHDFEGYVEQKNFALNLATKEWVLCLDSDECVTRELADEITAILSENKDKDVGGYFIKRHTYYLKRWINHCGWYPDWKLRLVKRGEATWIGSDPHDKLVLNGNTQRTSRINKGELQHYNYGSFSEHISTIEKFSNVVVGNEPVKRPSLLMMIIHPFVKFVEVYIYKKGFLDMIPGFIIAIASSFYVFTKYVKRWERYNTGKGK